MCWRDVITALSEASRFRLLSLLILWVRAFTPLGRGETYGPVGYAGAPISLAVYVS